MAKVHSFTLIKDGEQVSFSKPPAAVIQSLRNGRYTVTITREKQPRSLSQNALMWMWFACIEEQTGTTKQACHDHFCAKFLMHDYTFNGVAERNPTGTKYLTKEQFSDFLNKVQADVATDMGITLPSPEDRFFEVFYQTYKDTTF